MYLRRRLYSFAIISISGSPCFRASMAARLACCGGAHYRVLVDFVHLCDEFLRRAEVAEAPAGHRVGFGEAGDGYCAFPHVSDRGEGGVAASVGEFAVDFVGEDHDVRAFEDLRDFFELVLCHYGSGGVVRVREDEEFGFRGYRGSQCLRAEFEVVFFFRLYEDGLAVREFDYGAVADEGRDGDYRFVARFDQRAYG